LVFRAKKKKPSKNQLIRILSSLCGAQVYLGW